MLCATPQSPGGPKPFGRDGSGAAPEGIVVVYVDADAAFLVFGWLVVRLIGRSWWRVIWGRGGVVEWSDDGKLMEDNGREAVSAEGGWSAGWLSRSITLSFGNEMGWKEARMDWAEEH
ncbi:uncharacterized protein BDR25DRAFT_308955 [Lindgomyces ingoldianus]|uniref:Uncharacterized protein n=1 Tax=Lindgomyces ingoldianus TaxID=673940 RepID=A0ACB6RIJ4_9PLEO|nr:uncharacterized protein BDR25DRAFT_308955 [Lindgomyces ingoldianus]KAF2478147.1 hypothetical protein BDR25DRAFT_308955 [Lindgomyces ingoldianus]